MTDLQSLEQAFSEHDWYAVAALAIGLLIYAWRKLAPSLWEKIPACYQWVPAVLLGAGTGFVGAKAAGRPVGAAFLQAFGGALWAGLPAIGAHHVLKDAPFVPYQGERGTKKNPPGSQTPCPVEPPTIPAPAPVKPPIEPDPFISVQPGPMIFDADPELTPTDNPKRSDPPKA